jgi:hypothetical protein
MPPTKFVKAGAAMVVGKISFNRMFDIVTKYIGGWGNEQITYAFEGYKNGECVATVVRTAVTELHLEVKADATINTESPAWAIDRLSILQLKIYHMRIEANREDSPEEQRNRCAEKLAVLLEQEKDLTSAIDMLLADMEAGKKYMKVYKQMKMYNDPSLNPVLYAQNGSNK